MTHVTTYADADAFLHTRGKPVDRKKIANNTYLERHQMPGYVDVRAISVKLHATRVVTYSEDGLIVLNTGGWLTVTTKDRINAALPAPWRVSSVQGTWYLTQYRAYGDDRPTAKYRYTDGISLRRSTAGWDVVVATCLPDGDVAKDDAHNATMKRLIGQYVRGLGGNGHGDWEHGKPCSLCITIDTEPLPSGRERYITVGDRMGDTQHLVDHMLDGRYPYDLGIAALSERGYIPENVLGHRDITRRALRAYLGVRLFRGATAPAHGKRPVAV